MVTDVGFIWDIDGVVVDSPHEDAWCTIAQKEPWDVDGVDSNFYFTHVASKPRYEGGDNILRLKGVYERLGATTQQQRNLYLEKFCSEKNALIRELIRTGKFKLFADAVTLLLKAKSKGIWQAAASASKNAKGMLQIISKQRIVEEIGDTYGVVREEDTLYSIFDVDVCGVDLGGKEDIQKFAAEKLKELASGKLTRFVVFEDAPSGIKAAKSLGYFAVGVWRIGEKEALYQAGADLVTRDLRTVKIEELLSKYSGTT